MIHFRKTGRERSRFQCHIGQKQLEFTYRYKYLGFFLDESASCLHDAKVLTESASRAMGGIRGETKVLSYGLLCVFKTVSWVCPVADMCEKWG